VNELVALSVGLGLVFGLLCTEAFGLAATGLVVPGYVALQLQQPRALVATLAVALVTLATVSLASRIVLVYGRRRSAAMLLVGYLLGMLATRLAGFWGGGGDDATIGLVVPGLLALSMDRQGVVQTLAAVTVVSVLVRLALVVIGVEVPA